MSNDEKLTIDEVINLLENERECVLRSIRGCNRNCSDCDLTELETPVLPLLDLAIELLKKMIPKRVYGNTKREFVNEDYKGDRSTRYFCPSCKKSLRKGSLFCDNCGQAVIFPKFEWTPYEEGVKQIRTMSW